MQRSIVHVGYHKTASTWFQEHLFPMVSSHDYLPRKLVESTFVGPSGLHFSKDEATRALGLAGRNRPVLLSEENLTGYIHNGGLHGLMAPEAARRIKEVLPEARILMLIRNQYEICRSSYFQYVNAGGTWGQMRYFRSSERALGALRQRWKAPVFEFEQFEYDRLIAHYDALFGRDRVHVYPYEWLRDRDGMIDRLERELGLEFAQRPGAQRRANASMGAAGVAAMRFGNAFTPSMVQNKTHLPLPFGHGIRWVMKRIAKATPGLREGRHRLPEAIRDHIASHYAESNRRLMKMRDLPLGALGYPA